MRSTDTQRPSPADPLVGTTVSHFSVLARLGGGAQGVVYLARDTRLNRQVALKFLLPQWSHDDAAMERFAREAQAGAAAMHPNICTMYGLESTTDGQLFIVMAYYEGRTLKRRLEDGALGVEEAVTLAAQVADGLAAAHAEGVVHRDIKPGNLLLAKDGAKILDFGLARLADSLQLTFGGSLLGTGAYMSPEQSRGEAVDARSDLWATGVVLYEMIAGEPPFTGSHPDAVGYAIRHDTPRALGTRVRGLAPGLEAVVSRALSKDPRRRFQTAGELACALRRVQGQEVTTRLSWISRALGHLEPSRAGWSGLLPARARLLTRPAL